MRRSIKAGCGLLAAAVVAAAVAACGGSDPATGGSAAKADTGPITFVTWGGALEQAQQTVFIKPFEAKTGIKVNSTTPVDYAKLKQMVKSGNVVWDIVDVVPYISRVGCKEGWLEKLDFKVIDRSRFLTSLPATDCTVPTGSYPVAIAYRTDKFAGGHPMNWADFFDTARFPGKRSMPNFEPTGVLEAALLGDGVTPDKLYPLDVNRALRKLDSIKKDIVWWGSGDQAEQLVHSGEVTACACWSTRMYDTAVKQNTPVAMEWNQAIIGSDDFVIPKGSPHRAAAMKLLEYMTRPDKQGELTKITPWGPSTTEGGKMVDGATKDWIPTTPEHLKNAVPLDQQWWAENFNKVNTQFQQWLLK